MSYVRKDAATLTAAEKRRFVSALLEDVQDAVDDLLDLLVFR
ncbi:hypothetical protein ACWD00_11875 [Streptomyces viridiviolaceus]